MKTLFLALALLLAAPASAQIALVSHASLASDTATTTPAFSTTGANLLIACAGDGYSSTPTAPTDAAGNTWRLAASSIQGSITASMWVVFAPITSASETVSFTGSYPGGNAAAFSGVASGPDATAAGGASSGPVTPANANEMIYACLVGSGSGTYTPTVASPLTVLDSAPTHGYPGNAGSSSAYQIQTAATAVTASWTVGSLSAASAVATFYSIETPAALAATSGNPVEGFVGSPYSYQLQASGGVSPFTWALTSGTLPSGITLSSSGLLSSSGNVSLASTTNSLVFRVTDAQSHTATAAAKTLTLAAAPLTMPSTCAGGTQGTTYAGCSLAASGGTSPYTYAWLTDSAHVGLPEGLTLNTSTGAIAGIVTGQGEYDTTFTATDSAGASLAQTVPLHIAGNNSALASIFFPPDHFLHGYDISQLPVDNSPATPASLPGTVQLVGGHYVSDGGIPLNYAPGTQASIPINCTPPAYVCEATSGPFSASTAIEGTANSYYAGGALTGGGDSHGIVVQGANGGQPAKLFDTYHSFPSSGPTEWNAVSIDVWDLSAYTWVNGQVGADAAGLPIGAMIPTYDEVMSPGGYKRLTRMAFSTGNEFDYWVWPAQSTSPGYGGQNACSGGFVDGSGNGNHLLSQANPPTSCGSGRSTRIPLGEIYRLKASYTPPSCATDGSSPQAASLIHSLQIYGGINADAADFPQYVLTADNRWSNADLACLNQIPGSAWEPVNVSSLIRFDGSGYPLSLQVKGAAIVPFFSGNVIVGTH